MRSALDIRALAPAEVVRLINSTPLGTVLTAAGLRAHRDAAGLRIGDGRRVDLLRYVAYLAGLLEDRQASEAPEAQAAAAERYVQGRKAQAQRNRAATKAAQDIAPIPDVADWDRRRRAAGDVRVFAETYFARVFWRPWSTDHLRVLAKIRSAVLDGGLFALAMPRGSGKTAMSWCASLWAVLYGHRAFVCLIGGAEPAARGLLRSIRLALLENPLLLADFPEAVYPLRCLDNSSKRQLQQHCTGDLTHVHWGLDRIVFPHLATENLPAALRAAGLTAAPCDGAIISTTSLDANLRGQQHARPDGTLIRPSLVLLDDPQTRESARSAEQTRKRLELLYGDVLCMAGPGEQIAALMTCTKTYSGDLADQILDREKSPEWDSECIPLMRSMPSPEAMKLWEQYAEARRCQGRAAATGFYRRNRKAMDAGAEAAWPQRYDAKGGELSAVQHAMNLRLRVGLDAFAAEYQNSPSLGQVSEHALTVDNVCGKLNGLKRGEVPPAATRLTMFADVHDRLLYYVVCAWEENFTGSVIEYGTMPEQNRALFSLSDCPHPLGRAFVGAGPAGAIHAGLERLVATYLAREWKRGPTILRIERLLVDSGYKPGVVESVKRKVGGATMQLSKGVGIRATRRPMAAYARRPGETLGDHWYIPNVRATHQFQHVLLDTNHWKSFVHEALASAQADPGSMTLYGGPKTDHALFAEHIARSERWVEVTGPYGTVREWVGLPTRPDNHWLDCLAGCAAAASMCGCRPVGGEAVAVRVRKKYSQADLRRR